VGKYENSPQNIPTRPSPRSLPFLLTYHPHPAPSRFYIRFKRRFSFYGNLTPVSECLRKVFPMCSRGPMGGICVYVCMYIYIVSLQHPISHARTHLCTYPLVDTYRPTPCPICQWHTHPSHYSSAIHIRSKCGHRAGQSIRNRH
jgi:hypothetical protein